MEKNTQANVQIDFGVDLAEMFAMVHALYLELQEKQSQSISLEDEMLALRTSAEELKNHIAELEQENTELYSNQETLLEHVWDSDVVWFEGWCLEENANIIHLFCGRSERGNDNRLALVARSGSWNNLVEFWELLAHRCEEEERKANEDEERALEIVLQLFNHSQRSKKAQLSVPIVGDVYRSSVHRKLKGEGETISSVWLPGLINVQGERKTKPLIVTQETN